MGLFKQLKEMKATLSDESGPNPSPNGTAGPQEPGTGTGTTRRIATSADRNPAPTRAPHAATNGDGQTFAAFGPDFEPISMVSLALYAQICRNLDTFDDARGEMLRRAETLGISAEDWRAASAGWSARIQANPAVEWTFTALYDTR